MAKRVFCLDCQYISSDWNYTTSECLHPKNCEARVTWFTEKTCRPWRKPSDINSDNDCEWYVKRKDYMKQVWEL